MVDAGSAQIVMGNHEFNAIAYATVLERNRLTDRRFGSGRAFSSNSDTMGVQYPSSLFGPNRDRLQPFRFETDD
jgi:hypothetical protein